LAFEHAALVLRHVTDDNLAAVIPLVLSHDLAPQQFNLSTEFIMRRTAIAAH